MSDFAKAENKNWQKEVRGKLQDLKLAVRASNHQFNEWEVEFIYDIIQKLEDDIIYISPRQYSKVWDLWDKI